MKAIPMRGRLVGKRIAGYLWAGPRKTWRKKENYFQLEDGKLVTAVLGTQAGFFWIRCKGATCEVTLRTTRGRVLATSILAFPHGRKR